MTKALTFWSVYKLEHNGTCSATFWLCSRRWKKKQKRKTPNDFLSRAAVWSKMTGCLRRPTWLWSTTTETLNLFAAALWTLGGSCMFVRSDGGRDCVTCRSFNHRADRTSDTDVNETRSRGCAAALSLSHRGKSIGNPFTILSVTTHLGSSTCVTINVRVYSFCYGCLAVIFQNKMQIFDGLSFSNVKNCPCFSSYIIEHWVSLSFRTLLNKRRLFLLRLPVRLITTSGVISFLFFIKSFIMQKKMLGIILISLIPCKLYWCHFR